MKNIWGAVFVGFLSTAVTVIAIGTLTVPPGDRSDFFWLRMVWCEFLAMLVWGYVGSACQCLFAPQSPENSSKGTLPALGILVFFYAAGSVGLLTYFSWFPMGGIHLALQAILASLIVGSATLLHLAQTAHRSGHARTARRVAARYCDENTGRP